VITGDQAIALLGILGQASITQTQLQQALVAQREANGDGARAIEELRADNAALKARLDQVLDEPDAIRFKAENDQLREEANHLRVERADLLAKVDRLEHRGPPFARPDVVEKAQRDQS
jgi:hypothetical protein